MAVIVHTFKLNKPHYIVCVKSGSNWIKYDAKIKKIGSKSVLDIVGTLVAKRIKPLIIENSSEVSIPAHLQEILQAVPAA